MGNVQGTTSVALKKPKSNEDLAEIEQEVTMLQSLSHKNIVQVIFHEISHSQFFLSFLESM
jgi:serine/threonine protein kinase